MRARVRSCAILPHCSTIAGFAHAVCSSRTCRYEHAHARTHARAQSIFTSEACLYLRAGIGAGEFCRLCVCMCVPVGVQSPRPLQMRLLTPLGQVAEHCEPSEKT
jgi:hypothetical protein